MARRRSRRFGSPNIDHIIGAEEALKQAYKHAAKIDAAARNSDCQKVWQEIMNTYGAVRQADVHLDSVGTGTSTPQVKRFEQAMQNKRGLYRRITDSIESVGWQCTRESRGFGGTRRATKR